MLIFDMIYVDWIVKKEKSTNTLRRLSQFFGVWGMTVETHIAKKKKKWRRSRKRERWSDEEEDGKKNEMQKKSDENSLYVKPKL